jgi:hypothetical protein
MPYARVRPHPRDAFTAWTCPHCGVRQTLDPRGDVYHLIETLPVPRSDRGLARRVRAPRIPTLELEAKRCREADCASVTVTAHLGAVTREDAGRLRRDAAVRPPDPRRATADAVDFHLAPEHARPPLPTTVPERIRRDVAEARAVAAPSPRAAAALYRRALRGMVDERASGAEAVGPGVREALDGAPADPFAEVAVGDVAALGRLVDRVAATCYDESAEP